ncbi:MAG: alpha/beta hydrolase, partial [Betaproteobacteria bacterium]|nr:alpha/beta hydrolase [Betaproteobacteria bacterium]
MVGINATYRLIPKAKYPNGADDVAAMVRWAKANVAKHGGDPNAIFVFGHSVGGTVVGGYLYNQSVQPEGDPSVLGALLLSPAVGGERTGPREKVALDYYGEDRNKWAENVPLGLYNTYQGRKVPTMFVIAEYDPPQIEGPAVELMSRICAKEQA